VSAVRAVVADDHPVFRSGLRVLLEELGVEVVAEAADGGSAVDLALEHRPDVVLMDLQMPGVNGLEATRRLAEAAPEVRVLVLTMVEDDDTLFAALRAGAVGYCSRVPGRTRSTVPCGGSPRVTPSTGSASPSGCAGCSPPGRSPPGRLPAARRAGARRAGPHGGRYLQPRDRRPAVPVGQDGPQLRLEHLR
jgi:CheY-like chemotaxis protein